MRFTLRGGRLALPTGITDGDLRVVDGKIDAIGQVAGDPGEVVDVAGLMVMPGVIDPQVHFREPGATHKEDLETGSRACVAGGVTSFLEMPNTNPPTTSREAIQDKKNRAAGRARANYGFFIGATPENVDELVACDGACGIKIFMGSSTGSLLVNERNDLDRIFSKGRRLIAVHAEDEARLIERYKQYADRTDPAAHTEIRDAKAALLATSLAVELSEKYDRRLHVLHMSTGDEADLLVERGKGDGRITCEVLPQHLLLNAPEIYDRIGTRAQMNPPLRAKEHSERLWRGLHEGTVDCIATDHAPHTLEEKGRGFGNAPSGMPGVETSLAVMLDAAHRGQCTVEDVVRWMTAGPADVYKIVGKGRLKVGFDADLALVDLARTEKVGARGYFTKSGWSPFDGMSITGWPVRTYVGGNLAFADNEVLDGVFGGELTYAQ